ncbi:MAG: hypothetical protein KDD45_10170 [Bdellovibrionales bacterium]|nr:hypothetical protein [Bdellovibrionales bacterium]
MEHKDKNLTSALKKITNAIETGRKNIESDTDLVQNVVSIRGNFGEIESVIKNQVPALEQMKNFSKEVSS